jgi:DNA-binding transcriptional LysR family regulator
MIDRLRQMAIFAKTIDHGSFRGAARELHLSPSVISHHISQLEDHLGVALIYRSTRKLTLTAEGKRLLIATHKMLDAVEDELQWKITHHVTFCAVTVTYDESACRFFNGLSAHYIDHRLF